MAPNPITPEPEPARAARLLRACGARGWTVGYHEVLRYWSAEHVSADRHSIRYLTAHSAHELATLIEHAEAGS